MAKKAKGLYAKIEHEPIFHKTSIGRNPSLTKMNKHKRRQFKKYNGQGKQVVDKSHIISYIERMKGDNMKTVTINVTGASQGQWSTFLLELNLMKKTWRSYGVDAELKAKNIKKIITLGTMNAETFRKNRRSGKTI